MTLPSTPHSIIAVSPRKHLPARTIMWGLLLAYLFFACLYNLSIPIGEAPDEADHVRYVSILLDTGQLPTIPENSPRYSYEAHQPSLYYLMQTIWMRGIWPSNKLLPTLQSNPDFSPAKILPANVYLHDYPARDAVPVHLMRFLSTIIGLFTLLCIWLAARLAWPESESVAILALGFAALLPGFTFSSSTVTNDSLAACSGAATILAFLHLLKRGLHFHLIALAGLAMGLGLLAKSSLLIMLPIGILVCLSAPNHGYSAKIRAGALILGIAFLVGVWPFVANIVEYGDPFATDATLAAKQDIASPLAHIQGFWLLPGYIVGLLNSLWGVFGFRNVEMPGEVYMVYYGLCLFALSGLTYHFRRRVRGVQEGRIILVLAATLLLAYAAVALLNNQFWAIQGRLLLPGFAALALLIGRGLSILGAQAAFSIRSQWVATAVFLTGLAMLNCYALIWHILRIYY